MPTDIKRPTGGRSSRAASGHDPRDFHRQSAVGHPPRKRIEDCLAIAEQAIKDAMDRIEGIERKAETPVPEELRARVEQLRLQAKEAGVRFRQVRFKATSVSALAEELRHTRKVIKSHRFITFKNYTALVALMVAYARAATAQMTMVQRPSTDAGNEMERFLLIDTPQGQVSFGITQALFLDLTRLGIPATGVWDGHSTDEKTGRIFAFLQRALSA